MKIVATYDSAAGAITKIKATGDYKFCTAAEGGLHLGERSGSSSSSTVNDSFTVTAAAAAAAQCLQECVLCAESNNTCSTAACVGVLTRMVPASDAYLYCLAAAIVLHACMQPLQQRSNLEP
jgi:hypothetical protein